MANKGWNLHEAMNHFERHELTAINVTIKILIGDDKLDGTHLFELRHAIENVFNQKYGYNTIVDYDYDNKEFYISHESKQEMEKAKDTFIALLDYHPYHDLKKDNTKFSEFANEVLYNMDKYIYTKDPIDCILKAVVDIFILKAGEPSLQVYEKADWRTSPYDTNKSVKMREIMDYISAKIKDKKIDMHSPDEEFLKQITEEVREKYQIDLNPKYYLDANGEYGISITYAE